MVLHDSGYLPEGEYVENWTREEIQTLVELEDGQRIPTLEEFI